MFIEHNVVKEGNRRLITKMLQSAKRSFSKADVQLTQTFPRKSLNGNKDDKINIGYRRYGRILHNYID